MLIITALLAFAIFCWVLSPFWLGPGGRLAESVTIQNPELAEKMRHSVLVLYLKDEAAFARGALTPREWQRRQDIWRHKYIDLVRRRDFLRSQLQEVSHVS